MVSRQPFTFQSNNSMGFFSNLKDDFTSASAKLFIRKQIENYGELLDFEVDSSKKSIFVSVMLAGEDKPVELHIKKYFLVENNPMKIKLNNIESNREWITRAAKEYIENRKFPLPEKYIPIIKLLL